MDFPVLMRKRNRLEDYDYSQGGAYFITICAQYKRCLFGTVLDGPGEPIIRLNQLGQTVDYYIHAISEHYPTVNVDRHCIMPNHVHMILYFDPEQTNPQLSTVINHLKGAVTKSVGRSVWQKGYYDHVIRTEADYRQIGTYIEHNAAKWKSDENYVELGQ